MFVANEHGGRLAHTPAAVNITICIEKFNALSATTPVIEAKIHANLPIRSEVSRVRYTTFEDIQSDRGMHFMSQDIAFFMAESISNIR